MNFAERDQAQIRRYGAILIAVMVLSFGVLLYYGQDIYQSAPPVPETVVTTSGETLLTRADIETGQDVWRSIGGHELGSVWGHGAYTAPDWTADWLHRESVFLLELWAQRDYALAYDEVAADAQAALRSRLQREMRSNTYDDANGQITVSADRAQAIAAVTDHYTGLFRHDPELADLREAYAMPADTVGDDERATQLTTFLWWATWSCTTNRPGEDVTYTQNWPPEDLVGNRPTGVIVVVSVASFVLLLGGIGFLLWFSAM